ncbi:MAG: PSD1 domain-containing protein, partial [Planctomycetes bacterium]|nr:PSD1 domain-containing protein [Planctomycetota bacterium]
MRSLLALPLVFLAIAQSHAGEQHAGADSAAFFESRVRPILIEHCFRCHGPKRQKSSLRLDSRAGLLKGSENGPVVTLDHPEKSPLLLAIKHAGKLKMPPEEKLPAAAIAILEAWVKAGAPWPESKGAAAADDDWKKHWAFQPIANPPLPLVKDTAWPVTAIDRFVLDKLEASGLKPSPQADRRTLLRRATFDLIGLPPTPEEIEAFERDKSQDAFAKVIDRLLASPHYGERWGRHWLDVARYADTKGYVFFEDASFHWAYTFRDYVIGALNDDLPYDRFLVEQLAADLLPLGEDKKSLRALGFLTLGGRFMSNSHDILDDRIDVVTRGLMGLTVTCARCHDHKYDPITSRDYYALYGVFASCAEPTVPPLFGPPPQTDEYAKFDRELKTREKKLTDFVRAKHAELSRLARTRAAEYMLAAHALRDRPATDDFMLIADGSDLNPTMIGRWKAFLDRRAKKHDPVFAPWFAFSALADKEFAAGAVKVCGEIQLPPANRPINSRVAKLFAGKPPTGIAEVAARYGKLLNETHATRLILTLLAFPLPVSAEERALLDVFDAANSPPNVPMAIFGDLALLPDRPSQAKLQELLKALETWRATGPGAPPRAMVLEDLPTAYEPRVFLRGNPSNLGDPVRRRLPMLLSREGSKIFEKGSGRLELAQAIACRDNPLTARVLVNRIWLHHFGAGLSRTPSDFGLRGEAPSHPELLDHLSTWFMDNGWSQKKLHRQIMLSRAYQQKSDDRPEFVKLDPENRLFWKMNRRRLDFEATRDAIVFVTGKLDKTIGGPSVTNALTPAGNRRTLYTHLDRLNVPGLFRTFDFPSPDATAAQRDITTIAPQALFLMNHPFVQHCAKTTAARPELTNEKDLAS